MYEIYILKLYILFVHVINLSDISAEEVQGEALLYFGVDMILLKGLSKHTFPHTYPHIFQVLKWIRS